jgi:hypothetical protein
MPTLSLQHDQHIQIERRTQRGKLNSRFYSINKCVVDGDGRERERERERWRGRTAYLFIYEGAAVWERVH